VPCFSPEGGGCTTGAAAADVAAPAPVAAAPGAARALGDDGGDDALTDVVCTAMERGSWGPVCCNDDLNLVNYLAQGVGRDFYWPPNVPRNATLASLIGPDGALVDGCAPGAGLAGFPRESDPWAHWITTCAPAVKPLKPFVHAPPYDLHTLAPAAAPPSCFSPSTRAPSLDPAHAPGLPLSIASPSIVAGI